MDLDRLRSWRRVSIHPLVILGRLEEKMFIEDRWMSNFQGMNQEMTSRWLFLQIGSMWL